MKIFYDWEFLDCDSTIIPISLGMVREDGQKFYAVVNFDYLYLPWNFALQYDDNYQRIFLYEHDWLAKNVFTKLPVNILSEVNNNRVYEWDRSHPDFQYRMSPDDIKSAIIDFVGESPELWAYYASYDHVTLCNLFGSMMQLPHGWPYLTLDVQQEILRTKKFKDPSVVFKLPNLQESEKHHALVDAELLYRQYRWLSETYGSDFIL